MVVKPECETVPDESRLIVDRVCSEADDDETEFEDTELLRFTLVRKVGSTSSVCPELSDREGISCLNFSPKHC